MPRKFMFENPDDVISAYLAGASVKSLASTYNISRDVIRKFLVEMGHPVRNRSEAMYVRMRNTTREERLKLSEKAHDAIRGKKREPSELDKRAKTRQATMQYVGNGEVELMVLLKGRGLNCIPQLAVKRFNIDIAVENVAVELVISKANPLCLRHNIAKAIELCNIGWNVIFLWLRDASLITEVQADYIASYCKQSSLDPSLRGEYRVIDCNSELRAFGCFYN